MEKKKKPGEEDRDIDFVVLRQDPKYCDDAYKIILVGDTAVGKTCLIWRGVRGVFKEKYDVTIATEFSCLLCKINDRVVKIQVWDTCGQEAQRSMANIFYKGSHCAVLVYDITRRDTFKHLSGWLQDVKEGARPNARFFVVGNMADLVGARKVVPEEGRAFVEREGLDGFMEASAKTGKSVDQLFEKIAVSLFLQNKKGAVGGRRAPKAGSETHVLKKQREKEEDKCGC